MSSVADLLSGRATQQRCHGFSRGIGALEQAVSGQHPSPYLGPRTISVRSDGLSISKNYDSPFKLTPYPCVILPVFVAVVFVCRPG